MTEKNFTGKPTSTQNFKCKIATYRMKILSWKTRMMEEFLPLLMLSWFFAMLGEIFFIPPLILYSCLKSRWWTIFWLLYYTWVWFDNHQFKTKGRKLFWLRNSIIFDFLRPYYPLQLIKTVDLTPNQNYLLACFPHGVIPVGTGSNFCTNLNNINELYPNIDIKCAMLSILFNFPLGREFLMAIGGIAADKGIILHFLNSPPSKGIVLFPGGSKEMIHCQYGNNYVIVKKNRKGFIRIALQTGTSLVPVFSFGEQNTLKHERFKSPILLYLVELLHKLAKIRVNLIKGRGIFQQKFGLLPYRHPVNTVVGEPISVPLVQNPTEELVDEYHEKFYQALNNLFEKYRSLYDKAGNDATITMI